MPKFRIPRYVLLFFIILVQHSHIAAKIINDTVLINKQINQFKNPYKCIESNESNFIIIKSILRSSGLSDYKQINKSTIPRESIWFQYKIINQDTVPIPIHCEGYITKAFINHKQIKVCTELPCNGDLISPSVKTAHSTNFLIQPGYSEVLLEVNHYFLPDDFRPIFYNLEHYNARFSDSKKIIYFFSTIFLGVTITMALLAMMIFIYSKSLTFFWYSLYCVALFFQTYNNSTQYFSETPDSVFYLSFVYRKSLAALMFFVFYTFFVKHFIKAPKKYIAFNRWTNYFIIACFVVYFIDVFFIMIGDHALGYFVYKNLRIVISLWAFILTIYLLKFREDPLVRIVLVGSITLAVFEIMTNFFKSGPDSFFMTISAFIDTCVFAFGLGYRINTYYKERIKLIHDVSDQNEKINNLRLDNLSLNLQTLQSQLNPHFIFNSLNSINRFILSNNKIEASHYLSQFSKLIRSTIDYSKKMDNDLLSEIKSLEQYIELEAQRFNQKFRVLFSIDPNIDLENILVPTLLIQPYVENSILHGFNSNRENLLIKIKINYTPDRDILIEIEDNGIGINESKIIRKKQNPFHVSKGLKITLERIKNYSNLKNQKINVDIIDVSTINHSSSGTLVKIFIEIKNKEL